MKTHNPENERTKRRYLTYLKEAKRFSDELLDGVAKALNRFEVYTRFKDFKAFHIQQAVAFKRHLSEQTSLRTGDRLSKATLYATLNALRSFFFWLAGQPGYRSKLTYADADYFNLSEKDTRVAKAHSGAACANTRTDQTCPPPDAVGHRDRPPKSCLDRLDHTDGRARQRHCFVEAKACGSGRRAVDFRMLGRSIRNSARPSTPISFQSAMSALALSSRTGSTICKERTALEP